MLVTGVNAPVAELYVSCVCAVPTVASPPPCAVPCHNGALAAQLEFLSVTVISDHFAVMVKLKLATSASAEPVPIAAALIVPGLMRCRYFL